ncbi:MAG TPA: DinB family protein [Gemmatimonadaceae bacterium]|nr:DinB family protein [Gemmatimonadaceae bacterium]
MTTTAPQSTPNREPAPDSPFTDLDEELAITRRVLERYPDQHPDWRPHPKSTSLAHLAAHIATLTRFGERIASSSEFDFAATPYVAPTARTRTEILELFDQGSAACREAIGSLDADAMHSTWTLRAGDKILLSASRDRCLRRLLISHMIHHRAQLTSYYRLLDIPVPSVYGPSADEGI